MGMLRGRGRRPRAVAIHVAGTRGSHNDATLARIVLFSREGLVFTIWSKEPEIGDLQAEHVAEERLRGRAQPVGNAHAQRARRRLAGFARRAGRGRAKCT